MPTKQNQSEDTPKLSSAEVKKQLKACFAQVSEIQEQEEQLAAQTAAIAASVYALCENSMVYPDGPKGTGYKATKRTETYDDGSKVVKFYLTVVKPPKKKQINL